MKYLLVIMLIGIAKAATAVSSSDTVRLNNFPMKGYVLTLAKPRQSGLDLSRLGENVYGNSSNIYSLLDGKVTSTFQIGADNYVIIATGDTFIVYAGLQCSFYKKGDLINKHELVGYTNCIQDGRLFKMNVQAWRSNGAGAREDKKLLWKLIE